MVGWKAYLFQFLWPWFGILPLLGEILQNLNKNVDYAKRKDCTETLLHHFTCYIIFLFCIHSVLSFSLTILIMHQKHSRNNAIIILILYLSYPVLCFCTWSERGSVQRLVSFCTSPSSNMFFGDIFCAITKKQLKEEISGLRVVASGYKQTNKQRKRESRIKTKTHLIMVHVSRLVSCADSRKVCEW